MIKCELWVIYIEWYGDILKSSIKNLLWKVTLKLWLTWFIKIIWMIILC